MGGSCSLPRCFGAFQGEESKLIGLYYGRCRVMLHG